MATGKQLDISIIIVNWNVSDLLDRCLTTIKQYTKSVSYEIIVVDSASSDNSVKMVKKNHPDVTLLASDVNLGFVKGNNLGLTKASGRHIFYLNPDIELIEDAISPMVAYLDAHPKVGIVGCHLLNSDRTHQNSIGRYMRLSLMVREYLLREKAQKVKIDHPDKPTVVETLLGACLLTRGDVVRAIGGFDERYFMYQEETDMCLTFKEKGYDTVYFPEVAMIHHGSQSSTKSDESWQRSLYENRKSQYLFMQKHSNQLTTFMAKMVLASAMAFRIPILVLQPNAKNKLKIHYYGQTVKWLLSH